MPENYSSKYSDWFEENKSQILEDFTTFLKFPSISADPSKKEDVIKCSKWVEEYLKDTGFETQVWETPVYPAIFGQIIQDPSYPTILFYNHYDVQPVDPLDLWTSPPFEPRIEGNNIYARGACDDKGLCHYTLSGIRAFLKLVGEKKVNIKIIIEGEEEVGSEGFSQILNDKKDELKADYLLIVDTGVPSMEEPAVVLGCRGITTLDIECSGSNEDLHSGIYGGLAYNPLRALSEVIAKLWDDDGKVNIDGFYDDIKDFDSSKLLRSDRTEELKKAGIEAIHEEKGYSSIESSTARPTIEINGLCGGYYGPGFKTVIPAKATCKVSCRLIPDQDPKKIGKLVANFFEKNIAKGMKLDIELGHGGFSHQTDPSSPIVSVACRAYEMVLNKKCGMVLSGGSVPVTRDLYEASSADVLGVGFGLNSDGVHAPNEHFGLDRFKYGVMSIATILEIISREGIKS